MSANDVCVWTQSDEWEGYTWFTRCNNAFVFDEGTPAENGYKYCPACGKPIEFVEFVEEVDDEL